ncbi:unnamed protein product [Ilex paraguariensis]
MLSLSLSFSLSSSLDSLECSFRQYLSLIADKTSLHILRSSHSARVRASKKLNFHIFCADLGSESLLKESMAKHHPDLIMCRKQPGIAIGRLCEKCDGKCVICDSYVRPCTLVRVCDECNYGSFQGRCVICGGVGISDAYYCKECTQQEKDRDGCPKIVNLGSAKTDLFYERKKYGFKKR